MRSRTPFAIVVLFAAIHGLVAQDKTGYKPDSVPGEVLIIAEKIKDISTPTSFFAPELSFSDQYGAFALVGRNSDPKDVKVLINLKDGKQLGSLRGKLALAAPFGLSPDGKTLIANGGTFQAKTLTIFDIEKAKVRHDVKLDKKPDSIQFIANNRFITTAEFDNLVIVWNADTGAEVQRIRADNFRQGRFSVSPGGKYLLYGKDQKIKFWSLETGEAVDELDYPEGGNQNQLDGVAISPDGKRLAGLFRHTNKGKLVIWDLVKKEVLKTVPLDENRGFGRDQVLQWSPDNKAILIRGESVHDAESGAQVWKLPENNAMRDAPIRMVAAHQALILKEKDRVRTLSVVGVPPEQLGEIVKTVRSGGEANDALLPKLTEVDFTSAKSIEIPLSAVNWTYKPDAPGDASKLTIRPFPIGLKSNEMGSVKFSGPEGAAVFIEIKGEARGLDKPRILGFEGYSLTTGKRLGRADLKVPANLAAVSLDAKQVVILDQEKKTRLDVYQVDKMQHVCAFRPYPKEAEPGNRVAQIDFVDNKLLTRSESGKMVLWQLPACKAEAILDVKPYQFLLLSPTGKSLAAADNVSIRLLDTSSLQLSGEMMLPKPSTGTAQLRGLAFEPSGKQLIAIQMVNDAKQGTMWSATRWDLATGKLQDRAEFRAPIFFGNKEIQIEAAGSEHLLIDNTHLLDWKQKEIVWSYRTAAFQIQHSTNRPDGRHWLIGADAFNSTIGVSPLTIPEPAVDNYVKKINTSKDVLLKAGSSLAVEVNFQGSQSERVKTSAKTYATNALKDRGFVVDERSNLVLSLRCSETDTGKTATYENFDFSPFRPKRADDTVRIVEVKCEAKLTLDGQVIWQSTSVQSSAGSRIIHVPANVTNLDSHLQDRMWDGVAGWAGSAIPPKLIVRTDEGILALPGSSQMKMEGLQTFPPRVGK
jgi:WD40 repeat protein